MPFVSAAGRMPRAHRRPEAVHVIMLVVGLLAAAITLAAMRSGRHTTTIAVAGRELIPGDRLRPSDLRFVSVEVPESLRHTWIATSERFRVRGLVVAAPVEPGEPVRRNALVPEAATAGRRSMSIPIDPSRAVNGRLRVGDRVDVVVAGDSAVAIVASDLEVLDVFDGRRSGFGATLRSFSVTLAVDARESLILTAALADGDLVLTRVTGAPSGREVAPLPIEWADGER